MSGILEAKAVIKRYYSKYEAYINPIAKFILALIIFGVLNSKIGYMTKIDSIVIVLILALVCSFMPLTVMAVMAGLVMLLHFYALGIECALVTAVLFILMFLLYVRFVPNETIVVLITPILFLLKVPYLIPIAMGLLGTPLSIISVSCGVIIAYLVEYVSANAGDLLALDDGNMMTRVRFIVDGLLDNKAMLVTVVSFGIVLFLVYTIRRRSIAYSWTIAIISGVITNIIILLIGSVALDAGISVVGVLLGNIVAAALCMVLQLFSFNLDYQKTENLQFEDDEYYYYVKAVPKVTVGTASKKRKVSGTRSEVNVNRSAAPHSAAAGSGSQRTVHTANGASHTVNRNRTQ